jgi:hypothetical protein
VQGWIVIGGDKGLLKILKLDEPSSGREAALRASGGAGKMAMNQNLEGHQGKVQVGRNATACL